MAAHIDIVDLHADKAGADTRSTILAGLQRPEGSKELPTLLLYDERGLRLYDNITTSVDEYYLFPAEERILKTNAADIVRVMHGASNGVVTGETVLELGAGALRKTSQVLSALASLVPTTSAPAPVTYYALDLEERELRRTLTELAASPVGPQLAGKIDARGLCATYDAGLRYVHSGGLPDVPATRTTTSNTTADAARPRDLSPGSDSTSASASASDDADTAPSTPDAGSPPAPLHVLFLGSSLGNFPRGTDAAFLRSLPLRAGAGDTLLLALDHGVDKARIEAAYDDAKGVTRAFIMNGLRCAGHAFGDEGAFEEGKWEYVGRWNAEERRHEASYRSKEAQTVRLGEHEVSFAAGELVNVEVSHKYTERDAHALFIDAGLRPIQHWTDPSTGYALWLLERPAFSFPRLTTPADSALSRTPLGVPALRDFEDMWAAWDVVTRGMIPDAMLFQKPIDLRHICLFYLGHIPTFLDIHLSRLLGQPHTEPEEFKYIFERGIDPIVDDPTQCHPHSAVPTKDEDWPSLASILAFQVRVRDRLRALYADLRSGARSLTRKTARVLFLTLEHEGFHAETLLYMLLQRAGTGTIPPPGFAPPPWASLTKTWDAAPLPSSPTVTLGPATVTLGHDDDEREDEVPGKDTDVKDQEFGWDNEHPKRAVEVGEFRIEWRPVTNGEFYTFWQAGGKNMQKVQFPKSWTEDAKGEIMVRTLYGPVPLKTAHLWPIVTSYDNLSTYASVKGGRIPTEPELRLFYEKFESGYEGGRNVAFRNWHPTPATAGGGTEGGRGDNGGVFEWTSTLFDTYEGFVRSKLYPGYSTDFFDGHHQVVLSGSYATIPRIAERRSLRNYYQRNYPYAWVGARVAYDVAK